MFRSTKSTWLMSFHATSMTVILTSMFTLWFYPFFRLCLQIIPLMVVWIVFFFYSENHCDEKNCLLQPRPQLRSHSLPRPHPYPRPCPCPRVCTNVALASGNDIDLVGRDWWFFNKSSLFCLASRIYEINSNYLGKRCSWYCYYKSTFEAWKVVNVFSSISSSVTFSPHNFNCELILNRVEL